MPRFHSLLLVSMLFVSQVHLAQAAAGNAWQTRDASLYRELGGKPGIAAIVQQLLINIAHDPRIVRRFSDTDIDRLQRLLNEQFCELSGGPCHYSGASMSEAHHGKNVTEAQFNALVENLIDAMQDKAVPLGTQNRLLGVLAPLHADIVDQ